MKKRPIVGLVCVYIVFLIWVLVWQPQVGEQLFQWEEKEFRLKEKYKGVKEITGLVLSVQEKDAGGRARIRLSDENECMLILSEKDISFMKAGSYISVKGEIWWPEGASNPGQWDGKQYARVQNIDFYMRAAQWTCLKEESSKWLSLMDQIRRWFSERIELQWGNEESQMLKAMLLGDKGEISEETAELFRQGGISHVTAISGLHLTIVSEILSKFLKKVQRPKPVQLEVTGFLWFYVFLTGASVSTLRAAIMMSIRTVAVLLEREEDPPTTLALTAGILVIKQPLYLLDAGFCLSFAALLGMRYGKIVLMSVRWIPYRVRRLFASSAGIAMATMPLSLWFFYETSVYGFLLNFWVVPMMELVLVGAFASIGLSFIHPAFGEGFAALVDFLLFTFQRGSEWVSNWPGAQLRGQPELFQLMAFYGIWIIFVWYYHNPYKRSKRLRIGVLGLMLSAIIGYRPSFWRIMYLDVGQGDCAVIEWKENVFIVDAGPDYEDVLKPYLLQRGIAEIDGIILSHSDWDHMEGLLALSKDSDFSIKRLWIADEYAQETENRIQLEENVRQNGGSVQKVRAGYTFKTRDFSFRALSPMKENQETNEGSLVVQIEIEGWAFLFPGDIGESTERELIADWEDVDVLKVAHHGSRYSTSIEFLHAIRPELAVISCGKENRYGHPHEETTDRLEERQVEWYVTARQGAIWIEEEKKQLLCQHYIVK